MPTFIKIQGEVIDNLKVWVPVIKNLLNKYNVLVSIHPKLSVIDLEIADYLMNVGFLIDKKTDRNLGVLYQSSDLVLADYGGPVLSVIYMKKKLLLLNSSNDGYIRWRKDRVYIDDEVRNDVDNFDINNSASLIKKININIQEDNALKVNRLKEKYFGKDCDYKYLSKVFHN